MHPVTDADFEECVLSSDRPVLVLFKRPGCHACVVAQRNLLEIEEAYGEDISVYTLDAEMFPDQKRQYVGNALPVTVLFHEGDEVWRRVGANITQEKVAVFLDDLL